MAGRSISTKPPVPDSRRSFPPPPGTAALFAADKLFVAAGPEWLILATFVGLITFVGANVVALSQHNDRRLLGYSSVGQIGLVLAVIGQRDILGDNFLFVAGGIVLTHAVAKAGLFWLSDCLAGRTLVDWAALRRMPVLIFAFATFVAMLIGLPPFPGFYAKWDLAHALVAGDRLWVLGFVLLGALIEAGYMFRWFGYALKRDFAGDIRLLAVPVKGLSIGAALIAGWGLGYLWGALSGNFNLLTAVPILRPSVPAARFPAGARQERPRHRRARRLVLCPHAGLRPDADDLCDHHAGGWRRDLYRLLRRGRQAHRLFSPPC